MEGKAIIKKKVMETWQLYWDIIDTGRHLYNIQRNVGNKRTVAGNRREEAVITRMRIGHTGLNASLYKIGKHPDGKCDYCDKEETVQHVLMECGRYVEERKALLNILKKEGKTLTLGNLLGDTVKTTRKQLIRYLKETGIVLRM